MTDEPASIDEMHWLILRSLVESLRIPWEGMGDMANQQRAEAATAIETLLDENRGWKHRYAKAMIERDESEDQRDEARRILCEMTVQREGGTPEGWAEEFGWDCFKEEP